MKVSRETIIKVELDNGTILKTGDVCKFVANDVVMFGAFIGITTRGSAEFMCEVSGEKVTFKVMPASIKALDIIEHEVV